MMIDVPLTNDRSYIHGADIFDAALRLTGAETDIQLTLTAASDSAIELVSPSSSFARQDVCGELRYARGGAVHRHMLRRHPDRPVTTRMSIDEAVMVEKAVFADHRADAPGGGHAHSFMRRLIALYVALLERDYPEDYWTIAEIVCSRPPPADASTAVAIRNQIGGRFWKAAVLADDVPIGHVMLARGTPRW